MGGNHPARIPQDRNDPPDGLEQSRAAPQCWKCTRSPHCPRAPWLRLPHQWHPRVAPSAGRAGSRSRCCQSWTSPSAVGHGSSSCSLDSSDALLHMRAAQRQEGGQSSPHPAEEEDAALFRLQWQWFFPEQRALSTAGQF